MTENEVGIGIDIGTAFCKAAVFLDNQGTTIIPDQGNHRKMPSWVTYVSDTKRYSGNVAQVHAKNNLLSLMTGVTTESETSVIGSEIKEKPVASMVAFLLSSIKASAVTYLKRDIKQAVITVPEYFEPEQYTTVHRAAEIAGFTKVTLVSGSQALASFHLLKKCKYDAGLLGNMLPLKIAVVDFGANHFSAHFYDVTPVKRGTQHHSPIQFSLPYRKLCYKIGGNHFNQVLYNMVVQQFLEENKSQVNPEDISSRARLKLWLECEKKRPTLAACDQIDFQMDSWVNDCDLSVRITREMFHKATRKLRKKMKRKLEKLLKAFKEVDEIVLVGGCSLLPPVEQFFTPFKSKVFQNFDPNEVLAEAAAVHAAVIAQKLEMIFHIEPVKEKRIDPSLFQGCEEEEKKYYNAMIEESIRNDLLNKLQEKVDEESKKSEDEQRSKLIEQALEEIQAVEPRTKQLEELLEAFQNQS